MVNTVNPVLNGTWA